MKSNLFLRRWCLPPVIAILVLSLFLFFGCNSQISRDKTHDSLYYDGDVIFQSLRSGQSDAIQLATNSKYSHCGIVFWEGNRCYVFEAFKKVKATPIDKFIERSRGGHYAVRRLKDSRNFFASQGEKFRKIYYQRYHGKIYDGRYEASDDKIYCSELVWKLYKDAANLEIGEWKRLGDFDLSNKVVQEELRYTYGDNIPLDEKIISPEALFSANALVTVRDQ
jgi:hypothetical protein